MLFRSPAIGSENEKLGRSLGTNYAPDSGDCCPPTEAKSVNTSEDRLCDSFALIACLRRPRIEPLVGIAPIEN